MPSTKNRLQEIWQLHGDRLPLYKTKREGGLDHSPVYVSRVVLPDATTFDGTAQSTRTAAELSAATNAISYSLTVKPERPRAYRNVVGTHNTYVFVDLENIPKAVTLGKYIGRGFCVGFVSDKHPLAKDEKSVGMQLYVIKSHKRDAADFALAMSMAMFIGSGDHNKYQRVIVLTKDHFGGAVVDVVRQWWGVDVYHALTVHDCIEHMR